MEPGQVTFATAVKPVGTVHVAAKVWVMWGDLEVVGRWGGRSGRSCGVIQDGWIWRWMGKGGGSCEVIGDGWIWRWLEG